MTVPNGMTSKPEVPVSIHVQSHSLSEWKPKLYLKSCPRCHGDLYQDMDAYGRYLRCIQCGFSCDLPDETVAAALVEQAPCWQKLALAKAS